ncbi:MAG: TIR domain-containing protein [Lachnospiraceae bacterium]|nr:TIR domain-containing protein [Lachnospiraceae bacterium]
MSNHYNAFISYKHAPEDNKVAEAVHKGLERFHIPSKIRTKTGIKKIDRIFRDKDELPITNDLSDTIASALENSDYLIVICSTNTKESAWVPREIEYFLKNHTKKEIFTVLVDGEPYDVIPDILKYDERVVKDESGKEQTVNIPIEPLSCDFRMPLGKAKKTELPRLAAGLIGCAYDDLMNRHRQYRMKQITAAFVLALSVMAGFSGYMLYSRNKIHKNYLESLRNQSRYLANESGNLLEKEQRITALQLALLALPKDDKDDRPVTAEAVKALTDATLAYECNNGSNIHAQWNYQMPNIVTDFKLTKDGKKIAILDLGNIFGVWDTSTHEKVLYNDNFRDRINGIAFLNDTSFIVWSDHKIICYDLTKQEELWNYDCEEAILSDDKNLMVGEDFFYIGNSKETYLQLKSATGELQGTVEVANQEGENAFGAVESKLSPDGKKIAMRGSCGWSGFAYGVVEVSSNKTVISDVSEERIADIEWVDNNRFMVRSSIVDASSSMSFGGATLISSDHSNIICVDGSDMSEVWKADFVCNGVMVNSGFVPLGKDKVAYYSGNMISVYDIATGQELYKSNVNDSVVDVSDADNDGNPVYITENGGYATPALSVDADAVYYNKYFADDLRKVIIHNGAYVKQQYGYEVIYYGADVYDTSWKPIDEEIILPDMLGENCLSKDNLAVLYADEKGPVLSVFGLDGKTKTVQNRLEGESDRDYTLLGNYKDKIYLGYNNVDSYNLVTVDAKGNEVKNDELFKLSAVFESSCSMKDSKLVYLFKDEDAKEKLALYDLDSGDSTDWEIPDDVGYSRQTPKYYPEINIIYVEGEKDYVVDTTSGEFFTVELPTDWAGTKLFSEESDSGLLAISDDKRILLVDGKGKTKEVVVCPGVAPIGMTFFDDELVVLYNDGSLYWYFKNDGQFDKKSDVSMYYLYDGKATLDYDKDNNLLYITMERLTDVIDMENRMEIAHVENCFGHHMGKDIFVTASREAANEYKVGYYKRYTVKELMDKAHDILQNAELSDEMKSRYGIE